MKGETHYEYRFEDHSVLLKLLEPRVLPSLVRSLPRSLTPNQITIAGQLAALGAFLLAIASAHVSPPGLLAMAAAVLFYVLADSLDGIFARHTGQTSRLGEMLDHWLDALSVPLMVFTFAFVLHAPPSLTLASTVAVGVLHYTTVLHGFRVGYVHLGTIGMVEGLCAGALCYVTAAVFGPEVFTRPVIGGFSVGALLLSGFVIAGCLAFGPMHRAFTQPRDFIGIIICAVTIAVWFGLGQPSLLATALLTIATTAWFEGRVLRARLLRLPLNLDHRVGGALIVIGAGLSIGLRLSAGLQTLLVGVAALSTCVSTGIDFVRTVRALTTPVPDAPGTLAAGPGASQARD